MPKRLGYTGDNEKVKGNHLRKNSTNNNNQQQKETENISSSAQEIEKNLINNNKIDCEDCKCKDKIDDYCYCTSTGTCCKLKKLSESQVATSPDNIKDPLYIDSDSDLEIIVDNSDTIIKGNEELEEIPQVYQIEEIPQLTSNFEKSPICVPVHQIKAKGRKRKLQDNQENDPSPDTAKRLKELIYIDSPGEAIKLRKTILAEKANKQKGVITPSDIIPIKSKVLAEKVTKVEVSQSDTVTPVNNKELTEQANKVEISQSDTAATPVDTEMSMFTDYRFTDPQLPSSTSYYTSSTSSTSSTTNKTTISNHQSQLDDPPNIPSKVGSNTNGNAQSTNLLDSSKTIATLCNIGNSCYLNSVVYTLRFAPLFLHKLHHLIEDMATIYIKLNPTKHKSSSLGRNVSLWQGHSGRSWSSKDLVSLGSITGNGSLPKNNRLIVTEKLHELYQNLHKNESTLNTEPFHAGTFLQAIQEVCSIFEGNQQQDAHECLMCILDSIRETCDTLATAIIENPEQLLVEYGLGSLIEERLQESDLNLALSQQQQQQNATNSTNATQQSQISSGTSSSGSGKVFSKFLRKTKRKKSDDESTIGAENNTKNIKVPDSPNKERDVADVGMNNGDGGEGSSAATSPTSTINTKLNVKNEILKVLAGDNDVNDKTKLKENVCKLLGLNFFCEDFEGVTVSSIKCLTCEQVKTLKETMIDISVPITGHENPDQMNDPQAFFQNSCITKEYFRGENKYRCESCFGYTEAIRSINYEILPRLLVIHLKRFSGGMEKINSYIPTPFTLKCFCNSCYNLPDEEKLHIYKLYSVITHVGATMSVGHYVAYTCALNIQNEYSICTNDRTKIASLFQNNSNNDASSVTQTSSQSGSNQSLAATSNGSSGGGGDKSGSSGSKLMKKLWFGNKKANSSNDLKTNSFKSNVNGLVSKVANGMEKLNMGINNSTGRVLGSNGISNNSAMYCQGQKCCGIRENKLTSNGNNTNGSFISYVNGTSSHHNGVNGTHAETMDMLSPPPAATKPSSSDLSIASSSTSSQATQNFMSTDDDATITSTTTSITSAVAASSNKTTSTVNSQNILSNNISQDHWYMCDDDKIKVMQQQQFEEHLSPTRKNMITPYLLFYARFDTHPY